MRTSSLLAALVLALPATSPALGATAVLPTISIDLAGLDGPTFERLQAAGIYQGLVLRLVGERVALVSPHEQADFVLRFLPGERAGELRIVAASPAASRERGVPVGPLARLEQEAVQLEVIHAAVELVRQVKALTPPRPPEPAPPVHLLRAEVTAGALWTGGTAGVVTRLAAGRRLGPGELGLALAVHRPLSPARSLAVTEWGAFVVAGTGERPLAPRLRASAGLDLGVWQHRWRYTSAGTSDAGARLDAAVLLHVGAAWRLSPGWRAGVRAGALWTSRSHVHRDAAGTIWNAPSFRPFAGLALAFGSERTSP